MFTNIYGMRAPKITDLEMNNLGQLAYFSIVLKLFHY